MFLQDETETETETEEAVSVVWELLNHTHQVPLWQRLSSYSRWKKLLLQEQAHVVSIESVKLANSTLYFWVLSTHHCSWMKYR